MFSTVSGLGARSRVLLIRAMTRFGLREESFLLVPAVLIGIVTSVAAVSFHELILEIRELLYSEIDFQTLYGRALPLLILFPALGGLLVGVISRYIVHAREGHGIIDVIESVNRTSGFVRPASAIEKIITSALTIGTGGSAGAEGPIVQIGAAIASGFGSLFRLARYQMPVLVGCGSAAGISAIFNSPIGGVLFTLEVILQDFSIRTFTPLVVASVIANVTTRSIFAAIHHGDEYQAIFAVRTGQVTHAADSLTHWMQLPNFLLLGILCGLLGVGLTLMMGWIEKKLHRFNFLGALKPAAGGAVVGVMGIIYVLVFGRWLMHQPKPFPTYALPGFFSDGYRVIQEMLASDFYGRMGVGVLIILLTSLCLLKMIATSITMGSGGSGGVIAPSLFLGATGGGLLGVMLQSMHIFRAVSPETYALVGMGAALAAVVHAPLASILILFELTADYRVTLPAMLATVTAVGTARLIFPDSVYTHSLRARGIRSGGGSPLSNVLARYSVEQVPLEPASTLRFNEPVQRIFDLIVQLGATSFVVLNADGSYRGMVVTEEANLALAHRDSAGETLVDDFTRADIPLIKNTETIAFVGEVFGQTGVAHLPICLTSQPTRVIGLISRAELTRVSQQLLAQ